MGLAKQHSHNHRSPAHSLELFQCCLVREAVSLEVGASHEGLGAARVAADVGTLRGEPCN